MQHHIVPQWAQALNFNTIAQCLRCELPQRYEIALFCAVGLAYRLYLSAA